MPGFTVSFIEHVRREVTPGTSALFLLSANVVLDRAHHETRAGVGERGRDERDERAERHQES